MLSFRAVDRWAERVALFARQARERAGSSERLAELLEGEGIISARTGGRLRAGTVQQWMRGQSVVPGDTLLAMAKVTSLSLDGLLADGFDARGVPSLGEAQMRLDRIERELAGVGRETQRIGEVVARRERDVQATVDRAMAKAVKRYEADLARARRVNDPDNVIQAS